MPPSAAMSRLPPKCPFRLVSYEPRLSPANVIFAHVIVYAEYTRTMDTTKIGIREFRENLSRYLESGKPLAITRHGETLGFYIPASKRSRHAEVAAMRAAAKDLDAMIATWGASEDQLMQEVNEIRLASREEKKRNLK